MTLYKQLAKQTGDPFCPYFFRVKWHSQCSREGASLVPEAKVTIIDTFTLSGGEGWQVEAAARAAKAGWPMEKIVSLVARVREVTETVFTLPDLKCADSWGTHRPHQRPAGYHFEDQAGNWRQQRGWSVLSARTGAHDGARIGQDVDIIAESYPAGTEMRLQPLHANNPEGRIKSGSCWKSGSSAPGCPRTHCACALGAHTGPGL